jgi:hypothetical protein
VNDPTGGPPSRHHQTRFGAHRAVNGLIPESLLTVAAVITVFTVMFTVGLGIAGSGCSAGLDG